MSIDLSQMQPTRIRCISKLISKLFNRDLLTTTQNTKTTSTLETITDKRLRCGNLRFDIR